MNDAIYKNFCFAIWIQAINDINRFFLLEAGAFNKIKDESVTEIKENYLDAMQWVRKQDGSFVLVATILDIPPDKFHKKTMEIISKNKENIFSRSKTTTSYMYATMSRFRDYESAHKK